MTSVFINSLKGGIWYIKAENVNKTLFYFLPFNMYNRESIVIVDITNVELSVKIYTLRYPEFLKIFYEKKVFDIYILLLFL